MTMTIRATGASNRLIVAPSTRTSSMKTDAARIIGSAAGYTITATMAAIATAAPIAIVGLIEAAAATASDAVAPAVAHATAGNVRLSKDIRGRAPGTIIVDK
jgi:hypothetical protein